MICHSFDSVRPFIITTTGPPLSRQGSWSPSLNLPALLTTIRLLLAHPNAEDGLVPEATEVGASVDPLSNGGMDGMDGCSLRVVERRKSQATHGPVG